jgi:hypothetical protein
VFLLVCFQGVHLPLQQLHLHPAAFRSFAGGLCCCCLLLELPLHLLQGRLVLLGLHNNNPRMSGFCCFRFCDRDHFPV